MFRVSISGLYTIIITASLFSALPAGSEPIRSENAKVSQLLIGRQALVNRKVPLDWDKGCKKRVCTCGSKGSIDERIQDCAKVIGAEATWIQLSKTGTGQGLWKLVTRTGALEPSPWPHFDMGREVWKDMNTGLLWSSKVSTALNWCKASGSNDISNNPFEQDDPSNYCDNSTYQNTGTGPTVKAISACYEDGENYFTTSDAGIDNNGKAGLGYATDPSVRWRLPTIYDYKVADANGLRFVLPDADSNYEWSSSVLSTNRDIAWVFLGSDGIVSGNSRFSLPDVRCVGR